MLDKAIADGALWIASLGEAPAAAPECDRWLLAARTVAACLDRYSVGSPRPLGLRTESVAQRIDRARVEAALKARIVQPGGCSSIVNRLNGLRSGESFDHL